MNARSHALRILLVALLLATGVAAGLVLIVSPAGAAAGTTYYVSPSGTDTAPGTSPATAIRTLDQASRLPLRPGDRLVLQRGATYRGTLQVDVSGTRSRPILVGAYGSGSLPAVTGGCVTLSGSWLELRSVRAHGCRTGVLVTGQHVTVRRVTAEHNMYGVEIGPTAVRTKVLRSTLRDNTVMAADTPGEFDDYGANGVVVFGDRSVIARNVISGHVAPSPDFGTDGAAVEIFGAVGTRVHHNTAVDNRTFTELGHARSRDNRFVANHSRSSLEHSEFLVTRGADDFFGPVVGTLAARNVVVNTGSHGAGFWCGGTCRTTTLRLECNTVYANLPSTVVSGRIGGRDNAYGGGLRPDLMLPGDRFVEDLKPKVDRGWKARCSSSRASH